MKLSLSGQCGVGKEQKDLKAQKQTHTKQSLLSGKGTKTTQQGLGHMVEKREFVGTAHFQLDYWVSLHFLYETKSND